MFRIMLVDDDRNVLRSLGRTLHFMPTALLRGEAIVESFQRPEQALARAAECGVDLVIADYLMPTMNGVEFMTRLIALQPHAIRVLLSGYAGILETMEGVQRLAPVTLMAKPWDDDQIRQTIAGLLKGRSGPGQAMSCVGRLARTGTELSRAAA